MHLNPDYSGWDWQNLSTSIVRVVQLGNATRELNNCHTEQGKGGEWLEKPHANQIGTQRDLYMPRAQTFSSKAVQQLGDRRLWQSTQNPVPTTRMQQFAGMWNQIQAKILFLNLSPLNIPFL